MSELSKVTSVNGELSGFVDEVARARLDEKLDRTEFSNVSADFITEEDLDTYATKEYVDDSDEAIVSLLSDISGTVVEQIAGVTGWAEDTFQPKGDYLTATALDDIREASATWDTVTGKLDKTEFADVSGDFALATDLADYQPVTAMDDYYKKTETSGSEELSEKFDTKLDKSEFDDITGTFVTETELADEIADITTEFDKTSAWARSTFQPIGDYVTEDSLEQTLDNYVETTTLNTTVSELSGEVDNKLDELTAWSDETFQPKGDYLTATALDDYYNKTTIDSYSAAVNEDLNELSGDINETVDWVTANYVTTGDLNTTLEDYYKTTETSGKNELEDKFDEVEGDIAALENIVSSFGSYEIVADIEHVTDPSTKVIYLVEDTSVTGSDVYKEYIYLSASEEFKLIGDTSISLTDYYKKTETSGADELADAFVDVDDKIDAVSAEADRKFQPVGDYVTTDELDDKLEDYYTALEIDEIVEDIDDKFNEISEASATWNTVTDKLDKTEFEDISGSFATSAQGAKADSSVQSVTLNGGSELKDENGNVDIPLATTAADGIMSYTDKDKLEGIEAGAQVNVQSDWEETDSASDAFIKNKPANISLSAGSGIGITEDSGNIVISVTGDYADATTIDSEISFLSGAIDDTADLINDIEDDIDYLSGAITGIPAQVQSDWTEDDDTSPAYIQNKPTEISLSAGEGIGIVESNNNIVVSVTGDYADASDVNSEISFLSGAIDNKVETTAFNDAIEGIDDTFESIGEDIDFLSGAISSIPEQVQSDWTEDDSTDPAYIKNKPNELSLSAGTGIGIAESSNNVTISVTGTYALSADVDTRLADKLNTADAATAYYSASNPSHYEENVISAVKIAGTAMVVTDKAVNFDMIPASADSSHPLVTMTDLTAAIANFGGFTTAAGTGADLHPDVNDPSTKIVYLVKDSGVTGTDMYKEWICTNTATPTWELIGDTSMDLNGYVQFPASYTAGNLVTFGTNSIVDSTYTTADVVNVQSDWNESVSTSHAYILNKPTFTGSTYIDITTGANNQLTIDANINAISGAMTGYANVQSDWSEADSASDAYIANKPDILIPQVGAGITAIPKYVMVVTAMPAAANIDPNTIYLVKENVS